MFRAEGDVLHEVVGGALLALAMPLLITRIDAQTFYPREGVVPMWAALSIALRVWIQRGNALAGAPVFAEDASLDSNRKDERTSLDMNCHQERAPQG